jgi:hypothetical protein
MPQMHAHHQSAPVRVADIPEQEQSAEQAPGDMTLYQFVPI